MNERRFNMLYEDNYLAHYGVKGQKWGVRRYQNEDGSLTELGQKHYGPDFIKRTRPSRMIRNIRNAEKSISKMSGNMFKRKLQLNKLEKRKPEKLEDPESKSSVKASKLKENIDAYQKRIDYTKKFKALVVTKAIDEGYTRRFRRAASKLGLNIKQFEKIAESMTRKEEALEYIRNKSQQ